MHSAAPIAVLGRRGDVIRIGRVAVADQLAVDVRAARPRVVQSFQDDDPRAFGHDEAVAVLVERPAGPGRLVVAAAERLHVLETGQRHRDHGRL